MRPRSNAAILAGAASSILALVVSCGGKPCADLDPCGEQSAYPAVILIDCPQPPVDGTLTGTCAAAGFTCQDPPGAALNACKQVSFNATGDDECQVSLMFANGFVYSNTVTFREVSGCSSCAPWLQSTPEISEAVCTDDGGAAEDGKDGSRE